MTVKVKVRYPRPDIPATREKIDSHMVRFVIDTLKVWVIETVNPIPVWSGAARASFLFLAAKANTSFQIDPIAPSRITLGITEADSDIIADRSNGVYGWTWQSDLDHIGFVEDRVGFVSAGLQAIKNKRSTLPQPVFKSLG